MHIFTEQQARALAATDKHYAARKISGHWVVWCNDSDHVVEFDAAPTMPNNPPHNALRAAVNRAIESGSPVFVNQPPKAKP